MIPYGRHHISDDDITSVLDVLKSDWLTQGPTVDRFESAVASYVRAQHGVAVSSGTAALHLACLALDLGPGDWLWTVPNTFVASANAGRYCGANVDFVDIDARTYCMSATALAAKLEKARAEGRLPKVVIPVHFAGQSCDMQAIHALGQSFGFRIVEDASHAIGANYQDGKVGNCRYSDIAIFSFHPVKVITTGEGGVLTTNDAGLAVRLRELRSHGVTREQERMKTASEGDWYYQQIDLGFNYRLTDIQAALGLSQLARLDECVKQRRYKAKRYDERLSNLALTLPWQHPDGQSAYHLYPIRLDLDRLKLTRREIFAQLRAEGIGVNVHYIPVHTQPYYRALGFTDGDFPAAEHYYAGAMTLPLFAMMTDDEQHTVIEKLHTVLAAAST